MAYDFGFASEARKVEIGTSFLAPRESKNVFNAVQYSSQPQFKVKKAIMKIRQDEVTMTIPEAQQNFKGTRTDLKYKTVLVINKTSGKLTFERVLKNVVLQEQPRSIVSEKPFGQAFEKLKSSSAASEMSKKAVKVEKDQRSKLSEKALQEAKIRSENLKKSHHKSKSEFSKVKEDEKRYRKTGDESIHGKGKATKEINKGKEDKKKDAKKEREDKKKDRNSSDAKNDGKMKKEREDKKKDRNPSDVKKDGKANKEKEDKKMDTKKDGKTNKEREDKKKDRHSSDPKKDGKPNKEKEDRKKDRNPSNAEKDVKSAKNMPSFSDISEMASPKKQSENPTSMPTLGTFEMKPTNPKADHKNGHPKNTNVIQKSNIPADLGIGVRISSRTKVATGPRNPDKIISLKSSRKPETEPESKKCSLEDLPAEKPSLFSLEEDLQLTPESDPSPKKPETVPIEDTQNKKLESELGPDPIEETHNKKLESVSCPDEDPKSSPVKVASVLENDLDLSDSSSDSESESDDSSSSSSSSDSE